MIIFLIKEIQNKFRHNLIKISKYLTYYYFVIFCIKNHYKDYLKNNQILGTTLSIVFIYLFIISYLLTYFRLYINSLSIVLNLLISLGICKYN